MTTPLEELSSADVGERLRISREAAKMSQADVAAALGFARTTLVAIEQGQRRVRIGEIQQLAKLYRTSVNALLRTEAIKVDLTPQFRKLDVRLDDAVENAAKLLSDLATAEVELENLLGVKRIRNYPPERPILPGDVRAQAEQDALDLRQWLGLGLSPVPDIVTLLEMELGVRVYVRRFDGRISGLFAYDDTLGACFLLNANHPRVRRAQTAAHELAHLVSTRRQAEILDGGHAGNSREERYAAAFAQVFLMPARDRDAEISRGYRRIAQAHAPPRHRACAHVRRLARSDGAPARRARPYQDGTWEWFEQNGGISDEQAHQVLGDIVVPDAQKAEADQPTTLRLGLLASEAWRRGLLSEGQLSRMLHIDRVELRRMFDGLEIEESETDGALLLS